MHVLKFRFSLPVLAVLFAAGLSGSAAAEDKSLSFDASKFTVKTGTVDGKTITYRAYEDIVYVKNPVDVKYQTINIYVPADLAAGKTVNGFTARNAPIFFPNSVGGYMPGAASKPGEGMDGHSNTIVSALAQGFVVAAPGARGRTLTASDGSFTGKAPAAIVDLKAAVRYLRYNDAAIPGSSERIVSNGTSAGGALSALLGASGNNADYEPYLEALGAADARDDVWAVSAYCPITNLDNSDAAYEWLLGDLKETKAGSAMMMMPAGGTAGAPTGAPAGAPPAGAQSGAPPAGAPPAGAMAPTAPNGGPAVAGAWGAPASSSVTFSAEQIALSAKLKALFPSYVNGLGLKKADGTALTLDANGNGSFRDYVKALILESARTALKKGTDLSKVSWLTVKNGTVTDIDWAAYLLNCGRKKAIPSFDALDLSSGENSEFGTAKVDLQHFTAFGSANNTAALAARADPKLVKMMNAMSYIGAAGTTTSKLWRIRHGTVDSDTALAVPVILATRLANAGASVDFALPWDTPHSGDYDLPELFAWIKALAK